MFLFYNNEGFDLFLLVESGESGDNFYIEFWGLFDLLFSFFF